MREFPTAVTKEIPSTADQVLIAVNTRAGSGSRSEDVEHLESLLMAAGYHVEICDNPGDVNLKATEFVERGNLRVVVGAGGDGTIHQLLNLLPAQVPLAMLPMGTENLLARYLGQRRGAVPLSLMIDGGRLMHVDAGLANGRRFLLMASAGFDADVARRLENVRCDNINHITYIKPILSAIGEYEYPTMQIEAETSEGRHRIDASWCFIFNLPQYGFGMRFVSDSDPTDGRLDICTFRRGSLGHALWYTGAVYLRRHRLLTDCETLEAVRLNVTCNGRVPYQLDGDPGGWLPLELKMDPSGATLLVPGGQNP